MTDMVDIEGTITRKTNERTEGTHIPDTRLRTKHQNPFSNFIGRGVKRVDIYFNYGERSVLMSLLKIFDCILSTSSRIVYYELLTIDHPSPSSVHQYQT